MLSASALHAVRALGELSALDTDEYAGAAAVAGRIGAPANYLGKLLQSLVPHGIVDSRKGAGGGFRLARPAERISLLDVVEPIDRISRWNGCFLQNPVCGAHGGCSIHRRWSPVRDAYFALLRESTVAEVRNNGFPGRVEP